MNQMKSKNWETNFTSEDRSQMINQIVTLDYA
jgi:hypothetical protein